MMKVPSALMAAALLVLTTTQANADPLQTDLNLQIELTINFVPPTPIVPPTPVFPTLTGDAQFYSFDPLVDLLIFTPLGSQHDIGTLGPNGSFDAVFGPTDPCFVGSCGLAFSFTGLSGGFPADAFVSGAVLPGTAPGSPNIIPLGVFTPTESCIPTEPCRQTGNIVAFDSPVIIGTWDTSVARTVPEPVSIMLFSTGLAFLRRRKRTSE